MSQRDEQLQRLREAVDRKSEEAREASEATRHSPADGPRADDVADDQADLTAPERPQDTRSPRDKNAGKGKKTADKWNQ
ncbi:MAG: hypothetical protein M3296_09495 [Actinomycetota bacterium]|nr:hypothetical protein [Actinomycetota bacterium]